VDVSNMWMHMQAWVHTSARGSNGKVGRAFPQLKTLSSDVDVSEEFHGRWVLNN